MKIVKTVLIVLAIYAGIVVAFESLLGYFQPENQSTLVLATTDRDGTRHERVLARLDSGGELFVAANHWPRAWYRRALENPSVEVVQAGAAGAYTVVPVSAEERDRLQREHGFGIVFRLLTGFPPRRFLRLDPRTDS